MADKNVNILLTASDQTRAAFSSAEKGVKSLGREADRVASQMKSALGSLGLAVGGGFAVKSLAQMADQFASLQARLKLASRDLGEFNAANADLSRIAEASAAPLAETATLYTRIAASVKDLAVDQKDIAGTTEAVALALRISGASAGEASSAMLQFSQAIASGVLRGEEFNAVNESAPRLLQALAKSLNVPVGELREMAKQGQITREVLIDGLLSELPQLRQEAASLPQTIGAAFTSLHNKLLLVVGEFDKLTNATGGFSRALDAIGSTAIEALAVAGANVAFVFNGIGREIGGIAAQIGALVRGDFRAFSEIGKMMKEDARIARQELDDFEKRILGAGKTAAKIAGHQGTPVRRPTLPVSAGSGGKIKSDKPVDYDSLHRSAAQDEWDHYMDTLREVSQQQQDWTDHVEQSRQALTDMVDPSARLVRQLADLDKFDGVLDPDLLADARLELNAQIDALNEMAPALDKNKSLAEELGLTFTSAFEDAIVSGGDFSDVLKGLEQDIARIIVRKSVTEPLTNAIGGIDFGSILGSILPSANGNVFMGGSVQAFASGGVLGPLGGLLTRPTLFPMANGGIGIGGEAGIEAVMPLKRGADGKLGVAGGGSNVQVNVINNANGTQATASQRDEGGMQIIDVVVEQVEAKMGRNISAGRGVAPAIERRYGLNAAAGSYR